MSSLHVIFLSASLIETQLSTLTHDHQYLFTYMLPGVIKNYN